MGKLRILILIAISAAWVGCASGGGGGAAPAKAESGAAAATYSDVPAGSPLAAVEPGWTDAQVRKALGEPDNSNAYMTGKAWIPFYYGPDTHRTDWMYKGEGRVVFSRNRYSGGLKVINVLYNPQELM